MRKPSFTQRPLALMLGLAMLASTTLPVHAQVSINTNRSIAQPQATVIQGGSDSSDATILARLKKALPLFWAFTQPGKTYMILTTPISRSADGSVTSIEKKGPYTFNPQTAVELVATNAPDFVALLLFQYAQQSRQALAELEAGLASYFSSTRPGQGTGVSGGQLMRNSDGSATFTDGRIIFVFNDNTSALTVATMAPVLAAALANSTSAINTGSPSGNYALRDPSNINQLINFDGRMYDTAGNALPNASAATVAALFGNGAGGRNNTGSGSLNAANGSLGDSSGSNGSMGGSAGSNGSMSGSAGSNGSMIGSAGSNGSMGGSVGSNGSMLGSTGSTNGSTGGTSDFANGSTNGSTGSTSGSTSGTSGFANGSTSGSAGSTNGSTSGTSGFANGSTSGSAGSANGSTSGTSGFANGSTNGSTGSTSGFTTGSTSGTSSSSTGSTSTAGSGNNTSSGSSGTGLNGSTLLTTSGATGTASTSTSTSAPSSSSVCHVTRILGGSGGSSCK